MNAIEQKLEKLNPVLLGKFHQTLVEVELLLARYINNFPTYTDHSAKHTIEVFRLASMLLNQDEIENLNAEELYILSMACLLHDVGMCIPENELVDTHNSSRYSKYLDANPTKNSEELIRDIHHELSYDFILKEYEALKIPNIELAKAIAIVAMGHRKVALDDIKIYEPKCFVKSGRDFVCLPYLASVLRLADELDVTNVRTPRILTKLYIPNNAISRKEWEKHIATTQINFTEDKVLFKVKCSDQNILGALEEQFEKIQDVMNYCQKIIRNISNTDSRRFKLGLLKVEPQFEFVGFDPKGIKFSFNVQNVVNTFIGEDLYGDELTTLREVVQNAIDSCRYKKSILTGVYHPSVKILITNEQIQIIDNGLGMDEFIVENFFGKLGSSFYEQEKIKENFEAIGQFGVGVFSYFLLSTYIDIETKTENGNPLKFRIDKDPKNYFHFFDNVDRREAGTSITLHLKKEIQNKYKFEDYLNYIRNTFRFIEFEIFIEGGNSNIILKKCNTEVDLPKEVAEKIKIQNLNETVNLEAIHSNLKTSDFEGDCYLIINKFTPDKYSLHKVTYLFDYESFRTVENSHDLSQIAISQKGVFVNNYSSDLLSLTIGNINIETSKKIRINRKQFTNSDDIYSITDQFSIDLTRKLFQEIKFRYSKKEQVKLSNEFIDTYIQHYSFRHRNILGFEKVFAESFSFYVIENDRKIIKSLNSILDEYEAFILVSELEKEKDLIKKEFDMPLIISTGIHFRGAYFGLSNIFRYLYNYSQFAILRNDRAYSGFCKKSLYDKIEIQENLGKFGAHYVDYFVSMQSSEIAVTFERNKKELKLDSNSYTPVIFNIDHPFVKYCFTNHEIITSDHNLLKIVRSIFEMISEFYMFGGKIDTLIVELNQILQSHSRLNEIHEFTLKDFQK